MEYFCEHKFQFHITFNMKKKRNLSNLNPTERAVVTNMNLSSDKLKRLNALGLIEGTVVVCVAKSPLGEPVAFLVRGAVLALRHEDSSLIRCVLV